MTYRETPVREESTSAPATLAAHRLSALRVHVLYTGGTFGMADGGAGMCPRSGIGDEIADIISQFEAASGRSVGIVTALTPHIGYTASALIAKQALHTGQSVSDIAIELGLLARETIDEILAPRRLADITATSAETTGPRQ